jgi:hypothetical protein
MPWMWLIRVAASSNSVNSGLSGSGTSFRKEERARSNVVSFFTEFGNGLRGRVGIPDSSKALLNMLEGIR